MMRRTPIPASSEAYLAHGQQTEIVSDEQGVASAEQFEAAIGHMYNTGGPMLFGNEGLNLDGIDPQVFQHDLQVIESKTIVNDLCLNSTYQSQLRPSDQEPEHILESTQEQDDKDELKSNSAMSLIVPPKDQAAQNEE